jgi:hypothetical protein
MFGSEYTDLHLDFRLMELLAGCDFCKCLNMTYLESASTTGTELVFLTFRSYRSNIRHACSECSSVEKQISACHSQLVNRNLLECRSNKPTAYESVAGLTNISYS